MHGKLDLNLLVALDALLEEESVTGAAERLHLSAPAMSRTLGRIRRSLGDPVLVRAGRAMVPTPRALALRPRVRALVEQAQAVLVPDAPLDASALTRTFTVQANDAVTTAIGAPLLAEVGRRAPLAALRLLGEPATDTPVLREGTVDLHLGQPQPSAEPELRSETVAVDRMVCVVRPGHPLTEGEVTPRRLAGAAHLIVSRRGRTSGPLDQALARLGLERRIAGTVPAFSASLFMLLQSDAVGMVGERLGGPAVRALGLRTLPIPVELPPLVIQQIWHPRLDADAAHAWLRGVVREVFDGVAG